jgi:hypothetical protein
VGLAGLEVWLAGHPLGPLVSGICTLPSRVRCILRVTLILVHQVHSRGDTYFDGIPIFLVIS